MIQPTTSGDLSLPEPKLLMDASQFQRAIQSNHLAELWSVGPAYVPHEPKPKARAYLWRWAELSQLIVEAGRQVPVEPGLSQRVFGRVLNLINPASQTFGTTDTLLAGIQSLLPGETLRAHRHSMQAVRFALVGHGSSTTIDGEQVTIEPGDFVLTPGWAWHHHTNTTDSPAVWLDGLDLPLVDMLSATFFEPSPEGTQPLRQEQNTSSAGFTTAGIVPANVFHRTPGTTLLRYPWSGTHHVLETFAQRDKSSVVEMDFVNPLTGGPVMTTFGCGMIRMEPGGALPRRREVASMVVQIFKGRGLSIIDGQRFSWESGDVMVIPSWAWYEHHADRLLDEPAFLFFMTDRPTTRSLGFYRREQEG